MTPHHQTLRPDTSDDLRQQAEPFKPHLAKLRGSCQFFAHMALSVQVLFAIRALNLDEKTLAMSYVALGLGSIVGGLSCPRLAQRIGVGNALICGLGVAGVGCLVLAFGLGPIGAATRFSLMLLLYAMGGTLMFIHFLSIRQALTPTLLLGRMTSTMRWLTMLPAGPGALLGGFFVLRRLRGMSDRFAAPRCLPSNTYPAAPIPDRMTNLRFSHSRTP